MNDINCPYDGDFCEKKQNRLNEWRNRCVQNPQPYSIFVPRDQMFADCPIKHTEERKEVCARYCRYCYIVNKTLNDAEQSIIQMMRDKIILVDDKKIEQLIEHNR